MNRRVDVRKYLAELDEAVEKAAKAEEARLAFKAQSPYRRYRQIPASR